MSKDLDNEILKSKIKTVALLIIALVIAFFFAVNNILPSTAPGTPFEFKPFGFLSPDEWLNPGTWLNPLNPISPIYYP